MKHAITIIKTWIILAPIPFIGNSSVNVNLQNKTNVAEIFESFIKGEIIELIVNETNEYADNYIDKKRRSCNMRQKSTIMNKSLRPLEIITSF